MKFQLMWKSILHNLIVEFPCNRLCPYFQTKTGISLINICRQNKTKPEHWHGLLDKFIVEICFPIFWLWEYLMMVILTLRVLDDGYFDFESTWWWLFWLWGYLMMVILTLRVLDDGYCDFDSTWWSLFWLWEYLIMVIFTLRVLDDGYSWNSLVILTKFDIYVWLPHEYLTISALCFFLFPTHFKYFAIKWMNLMKVIPETHRTH